MATFKDVSRIARNLPAVVESAVHSGWWNVSGKTFAWERPFSKADIRRFGSETPPSGPILAVRVDDLADKEAVLAAHRDSFFTISHLDGYPAILVQLDTVGLADLEEAIVDGWLAVAPIHLVEEYLNR